MEFKAEKVGTIDSGDVFYLAAPLNNQIEAFREARITAPYIVLPEDVVDMRLAGVSNSGTRTSLTPIAVNGENTILYKGSPWMYSPEMALVAVQAHKNGKYPQLSRDFYQAVKELANAQDGMEPEDRTAIVLSFKGDSQLTPQMPETRFALGRRAKEYFEAKKHESIQFLDLNSDSKDSTDVNYSWFSDPLDGSYLDARSRYLDGHDDVAFGVFRNADEGANSAKNSKYTLSQIGKANSQVIPAVMSEAGLSGLTDTIARPLSKGLLERLRNTK
mgnify:CR=1 FL=1